MNNRLGKGIGALISSKDFKEGKYLDGFLDLDKIKVNANQPRKHFNRESLDNLVNSIKENGILQPITVKSIDDNSFEIIAGERRFRAAKTLDLKTIPAYIINVSSKAKQLEMALIENMQRNNLNAIEESEACYVLKEEHGLTHLEIAKIIGKSRVEVTKILDLRKLPKNIKQALIENANNIDFPFSRGHARTILRLKKSKDIQLVYSRIIKDNLSVRKTENLIKSLNAQPSIKTSPTNKASYSEDLLSSALKAKVEILNKKNNKGYIKISFQSEEDKQRIIDMIKKSN